MGKPLDFSASFRPISLIPCVSKLFERIILLRLVFFLESNSILSPCQAGYHPGRSALDQILCFSESISDGFNIPKPGSRTILATITFSGIGYRLCLVLPLFSPTYFGWPPPCYARWTQFLLSDGALAWYFKITKVAPFESVKVFRKDPFLAQYLFIFSSRIFLHRFFLPSAIFLMLAIWPFDPPLLFPAAMEATLGALIRLDRWSVIF